MIPQSSNMRKPTKIQGHKSVFDKIISHVKQTLDKYISFSESICLINNNINKPSSTRDNKPYRGKHKTVRKK